MSEFEHAMQWQFDRIANIGHGITPDDITESYTDIRTGHSADMQSLQKRIAELEAQVPKASVVRYYAGDFVCECGWTVDVGICGDSKFNYCPGCGSKLDFTEVEK
jgi:hypothetical protein